MDDTEQLPEEIDDRMKWKTAAGRATNWMRWKSSWTRKNNANSFPENGHTLSTQDGKEYFLWMKIRWILRK